MKYKSSDIAFCLLGPVNLTSITDKMEVSVDNPLKETTPFGVTAAEFGQPGVKTYSLTGHDGWFDDTEYTAASQMVALANVESVFMLALKGNTAGMEAVCAGGVLNAGLENPVAVGEGPDIGQVQGLIQIPTEARLGIPVIKGHRQPGRGVGLNPGFDEVLGDEEFALI